MSSSQYLCSHCHARFTLDEGAEARCPECMRAIGLVVSDGPPPPSEMTSPRTRILAALALASAVALVLVLTTSTKSDSNPDPTQKTEKTDDNATPDREIEPRIKALLEVTPEIRRAAENLDDPLAALRQAHEKRLLPIRVTEMPDALGAPRSPNTYLPALRGQRAPTIGSFEWVTLAGVLMKAKGHQDVAFGVDRQSPSRCAIEFRQYAIRDPKGEWTTQSGDVLESDRVERLSPEAYRANALAWHAIASTAIGGLDEASRAIGRARELAPGDVGITFTEGRILVASGLADKGFTKMQSAADSAGDDGLAYVIVGEISIAQEAYFKAVAPLRRALEVQKDLPRAHIRLAQVALTRLPVTQDSEKDKVRLEVIGHLSRAEALDPKARGLNITRAQLAGLGGDVERKGEFLRQELEHHPSSLVAVLTMTRFLAEKGEVDEARAVLKAAYKTPIDDPRLRLELGMLHMGAAQQIIMNPEALVSDQDVVKEHLAQAIAAFQEALALGPEDPQLRLVLAQAFGMSGDEEGLKRSLKAHQDRFPTDPQLHLINAKLGLERGELEGARSSLEQVFASDPANKEAHVLDYLLAITEGRGIVQARQRVLKTGYPHTVLAQSVIESMTNEPRAHQEVMALMDDLLAQEPESANARMLKAVALTLSGKEDEAGKLVDEAVDLAPEDRREQLRTMMEAQLGEARLRRALGEALGHKEGGGPAPPSP